MSKTKKKAAATEPASDRKRISLVLSLAEQRALRVAAAEQDLPMATFLRKVLEEAGFFDEIAEEDRFLPS
jgi:predicted DNA binding CopG/RHH family protein